MNAQKHGNSVFHPCVIIDPTGDTPLPRWLRQRLQRLTSTAFDQRCAPVLPEIQLLYAVIERAWFDLTLVDQTYRREAVQWFLSEEDRPWSFHWVCDHLYLTDRFRNRIRREAQAVRG